MSKARNRVAMIFLAMGATVLLVGCGSSTGSSSKASAGADRKAFVPDFPSRVVCVKNASSDTLKIKITKSYEGNGVGNTNGTEDFPPSGKRCLGDNSILRSNTAQAEVTIASGETFTIMAPPVSPPHIRVNDIERPLAAGESTQFRVGKHPILAYGGSQDGQQWNFNVTIGGS